MLALSHSPQQRIVLPTLDVTIEILDRNLARLDE
jgi:hypothetical protein